MRNKVPADPDLQYGYYTIVVFDAFEVMRSLTSLYLFSQREMRVRQPFSDLQGSGSSNRRDYRV